MEDAILLQLEFRTATSSDSEALTAFIFEHGVNEWNFLPTEGVAEEVADIGRGKAVGIVVEMKEQLVGLAISYPKFVRFPDYLPNGIADSEAGYIGDVVVDNSMVGQGIGTKLLEKSKSALINAGCTFIFIDCHEENLASRGMMQKAGFYEVAVYLDPKRRSSGSRKTWIGGFDSSGG